MSLLPTRFEEEPKKDSEPLPKFVKKGGFRRRLWIKSMPLSGSPFTLNPLK